MERLVMPVQLNMIDCDAGQYAFQRLYCRPYGNPLALMPAQMVQEYRIQTSHVIGWLRHGRRRAYRSARGRLMIDIGRLQDRVKASLNMMRLGRRFFFLGRRFVCGLLLGHGRFPPFPSHCNYICSETGNIPVGIESGRRMYVMMPFRQW